VERTTYRTGPTVTWNYDIFEQGHEWTSCQFDSAATLRWNAGHPGSFD